MKLAMIVMDDREETGRYDVVTPSFGRAATALVEALENHSELEIHVVACARSRMQTPSQLAKNIFYHGLLVPKWGFLRTGYVPCLRAVRSLLGRLQPDMVHGQGTERYAALAASLSGFPSVVTLHGIMSDTARTLRAWPGSYHWIMARLETFALKRASGVMCNSRYTQQIITPRARRTWLVPNAVREIYLGPPVSVRQPNPRLLLHIGGVCENKQQLKALELARSLWQRSKAFQLHFIGPVDTNSPYGREFLNQIPHAESAGYARFVGFKTAEELLEYFDRASALIHTPITETFGLVVAEALARDLKFFGFRVGGVPDIAESGSGAVLLPAGDWQSLTESLAAWLEAGSPMPEPTQESIRQRYHPAVVAQRHVEIYRELCTMPGG
jgi:glycosyltransferase involved in cell wall biosynthesis